jgi:hypothetical protein
VVTLVRQARRRLFNNELLKQGANASSAALIAFILLLLLGTQILSWQWAILIPIAAAGAGLYRARKRLPRMYRVAQLIDLRLGLYDTLSTAFFFHESPTASKESPEIRAWQLAEAERLSKTIDARQAVPYTMPRTVYLMGALVLVASSLFALRYGMSRSLDLRQPFARLVQQQLGYEERTAQAKNNRPPNPLEAQPQDDDGALQSPDQKSDPKGDDSQMGAEQSDDELAAKGDHQSTEKGAQKQGDEGEKADGDQDAAADDRSGEKGDDANSGQNGNKADSKQDASSKQDGNNAGENSSLLSKMKDAMQNLLSKMKPQQNQNGGQQQAAGEQNSKQGKGQQGGKQQSKEGQQQQGGQQGVAQEGQSGEQAQDSQDPQGKGQGKNDAQQASKQPGSGVGSQDGDKAIKQAEQLAAMGKISEILGKRSANITGESTVEVQSTSQQIRTQYAQRNSQHTQGGAEISRDEVPVALQGYVEHYFEQIRKQQPAKK